MGRGRSDQELQTLRPLPAELVQPVMEKFRLHEDYFRPTLFQKTFAVPGPDGPEEFPKRLLVLSGGADIGGRKLYRHRKHGYVVDPGGAWLRSMNQTLEDLASVQWFRQEFEAIGLISVEEFANNFTRIIQTLRQEVGAPIMVVNIPTLEMERPTHNYQFEQNIDSMRRLEFNIALLELSRQLDFAVVDADRIVRRAGSRGQISIAHYTPKVNLLIAREMFRIMKGLNVF
jgi:hypothetical protein